MQPAGGYYTGGPQNRPPRGPLGTNRSPIVVILLSIITCGIYSVYWFWKSGTELNDYTQRKDAAPLLFLIGYLISLLSGSLQVAVGKDGLVSASLSGVCGLVFFVLYLISLYKMDQALARTNLEEGRPGTKHFGLWVVLSFCFIGSFVAMYQIQSNLNDIWDLNRMQQRF